MQSRQAFKAVHSGPLLHRCLLPSFAPRMLQLPHAMRIHQMSAPSYSRVRICSYKDVEHLYHLLQAFIQDPARANIVTEVVIDTSDWRQAECPPSYKDEVEERTGYEELADPPEVRLQRYAGRLDLENKTSAQVIKSLDRKRREYALRIQKESEFAFALIILLFSLCENISTLYLAEYLYQQPILDYLLRGNYGQMRNPPLQKLKNVRFINSVWTDERVYGTIEILQYLQLVHRLPALETVTMDAIQSYQADRTFFIPGTGNMKKMEITHCDIPGDFLALMISIPKALEEFKLSIGGLWSTDSGQPFVRPFHIGQALYAHRKSLRLLDIDLDMVVQDTSDLSWDTKDEENEKENESDWLVKYQYDQYGRDRIALDKDFGIKPERSDSKEYGRTIGSLHDFPHLTHLSISIITLLGSRDEWQTPNRLLKPAPFRLIDGLPRSLEYLCIYGYGRGNNADVDEQIDELLARKDEKLSRLKVIKGVDEHIPSFRDIYGDGDEPGEDELYVRESLDLGWKLACKPGEMVKVE